MPQRNGTIVSPPVEMHGHCPLSRCGVARPLDEPEQEQLNAPVVQIWIDRKLLIPGHTTTSGRADPDGHQRCHDTHWVPWWWANEDGKDDLNDWVQQTPNVTFRRISNERGDIAVVETIATAATIIIMLIFCFFNGSTFP